MFEYDNHLKKKPLLQVHFFLLFSFLISETNRTIGFYDNLTGENIDGENKSVIPNLGR